VRIQIPFGNDFNLELTSPTTMKFFLLSSLLPLDNAASRMVDDGHVFGRSMHVKNSKTNEAPKKIPVIQAAASTIPKEKIVNKKEPVIPEKNKESFANTTTNNKKPTTTTMTSMKDKTPLPPQKPKNPKVVEQNRPTKKPVTTASIPTKKATTSNETTNSSSSRKSI
jgi:hypothetical protein